MNSHASPLGVVSPLPLLGRDHLKFFTGNVEATGKKALLGEGAPMGNGGDGNPADVDDFDGSVDVDVEAVVELVSVVADQL